MADTIAFLDFETTGLKVKHGDRPTEVAVVFVRSQRIVDRFESLMNPGVGISAKASRLTGITDAMLRDKQSASSVMEKLRQRIRGIPIVAHNASFERGFLEAEFGRLGHRAPSQILCTCLIARRLYPEARNHKLETLVEHVGLTFPGAAHRAMPDAEMTARLWIEMERKLQRDYGFDTVPIELMSRLQRHTIREVPAYLRRQAKRYLDRRGASKETRKATKAVSDAPTAGATVDANNAAAPSRTPPNVDKRTTQRKPARKPKARATKPPEPIPDYLLPENVQRPGKRPLLSLRNSSGREKKKSH